MFDVKVIALDSDHRLRHGNDSEVSKKLLCETRQKEFRETEEMASLRPEGDQKRRNGPDLFLGFLILYLYTGLLNGRSYYYVAEEIGIHLVF